jgi:hypothetical protein
MKNAYSTLARLDVSPPINTTELRTLEANAAAAYFRAWRGIPIKWRGTSRRPIPAAWKEIGQRTSPFNFAGNRNAAHPVVANAGASFGGNQSHDTPRHLRVQSALPMRSNDKVCRIENVPFDKFQHFSISCRSLRLYQIENKCR